VWHARIWSIPIGRCMRLRRWEIVASDGLRPILLGAINFIGSRRVARPRWCESDHGERSIVRHAPKDRRQGEASPLDSTVTRVAVDRGDGSRTIQSPIQRDLAPVRRYGGALPQAGWHVDERDFAFSYGVEWQRDRHCGPAGVGSAGSALTAQ